MFEAKVKITRFVDDVQPGIVECELKDALDVTHRFVDKVPMFYAGVLDENSRYPVEGIIHFEIVERKIQTSIVTTELPWHLESVDGQTIFEIPNSIIHEFPDPPAEIISVQIGKWNYPLPGKMPVDISIPLRFDGPQPNAYGVEPATSTACEYGELVGDTRRGGSCNFERITLIPHCSGTHTECVGHITNERISVRNCLQDVLIPALLVTLQPKKADDGDLVIDDTSLQAAIRGSRSETRDSALVVRALPNDDRKLSLLYDEKNVPPYFTTTAMEYIVECGFKHLLVDLPSIDRLFDDGKLTNHRIFWNIEQGTCETNTGTIMNSTITELIYVPNDVKDGEYLLNLQIAPFETDAAPSRPVLFDRVVESSF